MKSPQVLRLSQKIKLQKNGTYICKQINWKAILINAILEKNLQNVAGPKLLLLGVESGLGS